MAQKLLNGYKQRIKEDQALQLKIATALHRRNIVTVQRWIKTDSPMLTIPAVQQIIKEHLGLSEDTELLEERELVRA